MTLTTEQRREINRRNARKSTGPRTAAGKARSRCNALKHGIRADVLPMPEPEPGVVAARAKAWHDYYRPASPEATRAVDDCVRATLQSDRCRALHDAALDRQVRAATAEWDGVQEAEHARLIALLETDPPRALRGLRRTAPGAAYLLSRWQRLADVLATEGHWPAADLAEALRLRGPGVEEDRLLRWRTPGSRPARTGGARPPRSSGPTPCLRSGAAVSSARGAVPTARPRDLLGDVAADEGARLAAEAARLHDEVAVPDRAGAAEPAMILQDDREASRFLRYLADTRSAFLRAFRDLDALLDRDAAVRANEPNREEAGTEVPGVAAVAPLDRDAAVRANEPNREEAGTEVPGVAAVGALDRDAAVRATNRTAKGPGRRAPGSRPSRPSTATPRSARTNQIEKRPGRRSPGSRPSRPSTATPRSARTNRTAKGPDRRARRSRPLPMPRPPGRFPRTKRFRASRG